MSSLSSANMAVAGFHLIGKRPWSTAAWIAAYALFVAIIMAALFAIILAPGHQLTSSLQTMAGPPTPARAAMMAKNMVIIFAVALPLALAFSAVFRCAIYRAMLRPKERGLFYLRLGGDELRMILLKLEIFLTVVVGEVILIALGAGAVYASRFIPMPYRPWAIGAVWLLLVWMAFYVILRLSLAAPMTFAERRLSLFRSWGLTRGRVGALLGGFLLVFGIWLEFVVASYISGFILGLGWGLIHGVRPLATPLVQPLTQPLVGHVATMGPLVTAAGIIGLVLGVMQIIVAVAAAAEAYRVLKPDAAAA